MKISRNLILSYVILIIMVLVIISKIMTVGVDEKIQYATFIIDFVNIPLSLIIYKNIRTEYKSFIIVPANICFLFLMDIMYKMVYYLGMSNSFVLYETITFAWYISTVIGLTLLLIKFVYAKRESYLLSASFLFVAFIIILFFSPNFLKYLYYPYNSLDLSFHITIFYLCILLIIGTQNKYVLLTICGLCFAEIGNFAMTECYLQNNRSGLVYGELGWFIGILVFSVGLLCIVKCKFYNPREWFFNSKTIRNKFAFLIFTISIWSFIIACVVMKQLSIISDTSLVFIPAIGMLYSMITAIFSVVMSKQMERPFKLMQQNIQFLFKEDKNSINESFNLIEFQELNKFINESYEYKTALEKHIVSLATRVAHDFRSPLQIMENLIESTGNNPTVNLQPQLAKQINKLNYMSRSLLKENKHFIADKSYGLQSLYSILEDLVLDKQIEWKTENQIINFEYIPNQIIWLDNEQSKIKSIISNLLNNAFEATSGEANNINLIASLKKNNIVIYIQDFGCGISKEHLSDILGGKTFKVNGNGIGLSSAQKFMLSINGSLVIDSEIDQGTTINLEFPMLSFPEKFATQINLNTENVIVVDDNSEIINFWQEYFLFNAADKNVKYFINFSSLNKFLTQESNSNDGAGDCFAALAMMSSNVTYLLDYSIFGEKVTGVDVIKEFQLTNVYLITNYAEDIKLQDEIKPLKLQLVPKSMLPIMLKNKAIYQ